ncbi:hypothetical protein OC835_006469 [Tilletia horrida]|nr:hypothetical protein OC835_006469 [Tilletia horrida]
MPAATASSAHSGPPKRRVLGGISTTVSASSSSSSSSSSPSGGTGAGAGVGAASSSSSSTSPNPVRVLRPHTAASAVAAHAHGRPPSSQGRPLSTSTLSPPGASSASSSAAASSSSPRIRAKVDLANIVSPSSSSSTSGSPSVHHHHSSAYGTPSAVGGRTSPFKLSHQHQQAPLRRTGSTTSIPIGGQPQPPRIHLSSTHSSHAGSSAASASSPSSTRSNSIVNLGGPPSPNVTIRVKHRNQSVDLGAGPHASVTASARLPSSLAPNSHSPQTHRRISSSSATPSTATSSVLSSHPFPAKDSQPHHYHSTISPPSSSVSSSASSTRRAHVINGGSSGIKVQSPTLAEHPNQPSAPPSSTSSSGQPTPSISLATPYESPVLRYEALKDHDLSPTSTSPPSSSDPFHSSFPPQSRPGFPQRASVVAGLPAPSSAASSNTVALPSITHELQQQQQTEAVAGAEDARVAAAIAAIDAKKERKMLDLEITNKSLLAINANLEKERLKMSKEMRELRRRATVASAAAAAGGAVAGGAAAFGSGIGGFIALLRGGRKHSADGSLTGDAAGGASAGEDGAIVGSNADLRSPGVAPELENDEEYWLNAALAELTDDEDGGSDDEDGSMGDSDDEDDDGDFGGALGAGGGGGGEDDVEVSSADGRDVLDGIGTRRQRARQRALAERKVAQLVRDWQKLDAAHTRCRSLVEDMLLRGRLACKLSLDADQEEIVEEVRREEQAAEEERRRLLEMERKKGTRVLHPVEMEERREAERREREERQEAAAAAAAAADAHAKSSEGASTEVPAADTSVGDDSVASSSKSDATPPPTLILPDDERPAAAEAPHLGPVADHDDSGISGDTDNSDARSDISSRTERGALLLGGGSETDGDVSASSSGSAATSGSGTASSSSGASTGTSETDDELEHGPAVPGDISVD